MSEPVAKDACGNCGHAKAEHAESEGGCANDFCDCGLVPCASCGTMVQLGATHPPTPSAGTVAEDARIVALVRAKPVCDCGRCAKCERYRVCIDILTAALDAPEKDTQDNTNPTGGTDVREVP